MTVFQIAMVAAGVAFMLSAAIVAAATIIDNALSRAVANLAHEAHQDRLQRGSLAHDELEWRQRQVRERQTLLPPPPRNDENLDAAARALLDRITQNSRVVR